MWTMVKIVLNLYVFRSCDPNRGLEIVMRHHRNGKLRQELSLIRSQCVAVEFL